MYLLIALAAGAVVLAIYEWRKGKRMMRDNPPHVPHNRESAAYVEAERLRAQSSPTPLPHGSGMF